MRSAPYSPPLAQPLAHAVQIVDGLSSLCRNVAEFVEAGYRNGEHVLIIARPQHCGAIADELERRGHVPMAKGIAERRFEIVDVLIMLAACMRQGVARQELFDAAIGRLIQTIVRETGASLRVYAELVDVLAEEANLAAAERVEGFWNQLREDCPFTLLCCYSAAHFQDPDSRPSLRAVCRTHTQVIVDPEDQLARWLIDQE